MNKQPRNEEHCNERLSTLLDEELATVHGGGIYNCRDADGIVPERFGNLPPGVLGEAHVLSTNPCQRAITYDAGQMRRAGAGPNDWGRLIAHERAHTRGWDHGQGTPRTNPAYNPLIDIQGN